MHISFPDDLPISAARDEIAAAIADHQVVIVAGETGSGKTTQLPKILLAMGRGRDRVIGHTQPRRIAARSVAERIADELGTEIGELVGYQVRFTDRTSQRSRVKVMTDGILLAELQHDRELRRYDTIIIDEAHERSLNIDFLLGYLKQLLPRRPDLRVVVTSATIDPERFSRHFDDAPVIEVSGRTYPVEVRYRPLSDAEDPERLDEEGEPVVRDQTEAVQAAVRELAGEGDGDVLVFLPGEREIRDTADALAGDAEGPRGYDVLPLYSRLSAAEQHRVFAAHSRRRVVLATNVAETSLTVPGIRYVVDTGVARISRYSLRTKVQRLPVEPISRASANQRAGRCGRVAPGICIRLYSEEDFEARPEFTDPEILRTNLASVILQMTALGLGEIDRFPFVEPPDSRQVRSGVQLLEELGALRGQGRRTRLTGTGRRLARLPIDPRLGRMLLEADRLGCLREVLVVVAALSVQDPRERPVEQRERADQLHARFREPRSDFLAWLNLWRHLRTEQQQRGSSAFRRMCREEFLNYLRVREWQELERQLRQICRELGLKPGHPADQPDADGIHQALLSGLLSHIGLRDAERRDYLGARNARFAIFPGSGLFKKQPDLVMAAELVETSRLYARQVAAIDPAWAERLGAHLVKRQYAEPHWSIRRASAMARERVTLYGVPLVADRPVPLGQRQPEVARELFIRHALVGGEWRARHRFLQDNRRMLEEAAELEHRARRRDIVVDEETLVDFYDRRIPAEVVSGPHFDSWWKKERREHPDLLTFDPRMLVHEDRGLAPGDFPEHWQEGPVDLPLRYHFEPGHESDGVTVDVPLASLPALRPESFSWQVPGLREELVTALIRGLPKRLRVSFVPVPDVVRDFLASVPPGEEELTEALSRHLRARTGVHVPLEAWDWEKVPAHLRPAFRVLGESGETVASGRDLAALAEPLRPDVEEVVSAAASERTSTGQTHWTFGEVPETFTTRRAGHEVTGYLALVDEGRSVGLRAFGDAELAAAQHAAGVRRLLALGAPSPARSLQEGLGNAGKLELAGSPYRSVGALLDDVVLSSVGTLMGDPGPVRDEGAFGTALDRVRAGLPAAAAARLDVVRRVLGEARTLDRDLSGSVPMLPAMTDLRGRLAALVHDGFVAEWGEALPHLPRYLAALAQRHRRLTEQGPDADARLRARVDHWQQAWQHEVDALPDGQPLPSRLVEGRFLLEEYRVSLWAQHLRTAVPVSETRLRAVLG